MHSPHDFNTASELAKRALALMLQERITPHPNNFALWYAFVTGDYPELKETLQALLDNPQELTEERSDAVYQRFCGNTLGSLPLHLIAERIELQLAAILPVLERTGESALAYSQSLEAADGQVMSMRSANDLCQLISRLLSQTRAMAQQGRVLETQLRESSAEIGTLKEELQGARRDAMTDALTGIANRKMFDFTLREAAMAATENGEPMSLMLLDIDNFKRFNDTYGHPVGDHVLKLLAATLKESVKGQDTAARYGGEEFGVILPRTSVDDAARLAENIRIRVAGKSIINRKTGEQLGRVSVSIGVVGFAFGESLRQFVERADAAMYAAKRTGRNRVVVHERKEAVGNIDTRARARPE